MIKGWGTGGGHGIQSFNNGLAFILVIIIVFYY